MGKFQLFSITDKATVARLTLTHPKAIMSKLLTDTYKQVKKSNRSSNDANVKIHNDAVNGKNTKETKPFLI